MRAKAGGCCLESVELTARRVPTNIGVLRDPGCLTTLDHSKRCGIEPMFSDFKSRGFGIEHTQLRHPDRLARLLLVMTQAPFGRSLLHASGG